MITETQLKQVSAEAEKFYNLVSAGMIDIESLKKFLVKVIELKGPLKPRKTKPQYPGVQKTLDMRNLYIQAAPHTKRLQKQFNLLAPPHYTRVLSYLRTNDPKIF